MSRCKIPEKERAAKLMTALNLKKTKGYPVMTPPIHNNDKTKKLPGQQKKHPFPCPGGRLMF